MHRQNLAALSTLITLLAACGGEPGGPGSSPDLSCAQTSSCPAQGPDFDPSFCEGFTPPVTPIPVALQCSLPNRGLLFMANEVTAGQMTACIEAGGCWEHNVLQPGDYGFDSTCTVGVSGAEDRAASCINYSAAEQVCDWLGGRLPTTEEWIAEASAGGTRTYPWGEEVPNCERVSGGNHQCPGGIGPRPVCENPAGASVSGVCNMGGNIAEFAQGRQECGGDWSAQSNEAFRADNCRHASAADELMFWQGVRCVFDQP